MQRDAVLAALRRPAGVASAPPSVQSVEQLMELIDRLILPRQVKLTAQDGDSLCLDARSGRVVAINGHALGRDHDLSVVATFIKQCTSVTCQVIRPLTQSKVQSPASLATSPLSEIATALIVIRGEARTFGRAEELDKLAAIREGILQETTDDTFLLLAPNKASAAAVIAWQTAELTCLALVPQADAYRAASLWQQQQFET